MLIYLATPYSHPDPAVMQTRFVRACEIAGRMMAKGQFVFAPIVHGHPLAVRCELPRDWEYWRRYCAEMIGNASKLVVVKMDGWEDSVGIKGEIAIARRLGVPVEFMEEPF